MLRTGRSPGASPAGGPPGRFQPGSGRALLRALPYLRTYRRDAGGAFLALLLVSAANLASPLFIRLAIDRGLEDRERTAIVFAVVGLVGVALMRGVFSVPAGLSRRTGIAGRRLRYAQRPLRPHRATELCLLRPHADRPAADPRLTSDVEQSPRLRRHRVVQIAARLRDADRHDQSAALC